MRRRIGPRSDLFLRPAWGTLLPKCELRSSQRAGQLARYSAHRKREESGMGMLKRLLGCACLLALVLLPCIGVAQQPGPTAQPESTDPRAQAAADIQLTRTLIDAQRQLLVSGGLELTPKEMERFWPLYRDYRVEMAKLGDRLVGVITTFAENYSDLKADLAGKLLDEYLAVEKARVATRAKYVPKFKKVLPVTKVVRFYQIENKLDVTILAEIAEAVPLAR